jgi:hypothetical protein
MNSRAEGSSVSSSIVLLFSSQYVVSNSIIGSGGVEVGSIVACIVEDLVREFAYNLVTLLMFLIVQLLLLGRFRIENFKSSLAVTILQPQLQLYSIAICFHFNNNLHQEESSFRSIIMHSHNYEIPK